MLICVVSLTLQSPVSLNIHNLCRYINLTSPICFIDGGRWNVIPNQETNVVMRNHLELDAGQDVLEGVLVYRVQKRQHTEFDKFAQDESKIVQLLVTWRIEHKEGLHIRALLVEHDGELDEDKLKRLYRKYWCLLKALINPIGSNWLSDDATVLATTVNIMNGGYRWDVFISEGKEDNVERLLWIDAER
jgi:hypothetical protein